MFGGPCARLTATLIGHRGWHTHGQEAGGEALLDAKLHRPVDHEGAAEHLEDGQALSLLVEECHALMQAREPVAVLGRGEHRQVEVAQVAHAQGCQLPAVNVPAIVRLRY
jgi:hypothetical protein